MAIKKIESVSHQIEMTVIANKTLLVCDGYLCLNIGGKYENNYSRSFNNFGLIVQLDYNLCECDFKHQNSTIPMYLRINTWNLLPKFVKYWKQIYEILN